MTCSCSIRWVCLVLGTFMLTAPLASGQSAKVDRYGFVAAQPEDLRPAEGATQIRIAGDPTKPGNPANGHHFDGAKTEEVTVQIIGMGPVQTTRVEKAAGTAQR